MKKKEVPTPKSFDGKSMKLGGGGKFAKGVSQMTSKGIPSKEAAAVMAIKGREKYGAAKMNKMAQAGKKRTKK